MDPRVLVPALVAHAGGAPRRVVIQEGQRFGKGTVIDPDVTMPPTKTVPQGRRGARLKCDCGNEYLAWTGNLASGNTKSCGCLKLGSGYRSHPLRGTWYAMKYRCENPRHNSYRRYGGRGIKVCDRWQDFGVFIADIEGEIGPRPPGKTLDRKNNDGDYEPGNVRWASFFVQNRNKSGQSKISDDVLADCMIRWQAGESISSLAREYGVHNSTMNRRLHAAQGAAERFSDWWDAWSTINPAATSGEAARAAWEACCQVGALSI